MGLTFFQGLLDKHGRENASTPKGWKAGYHDLTPKSAKGKTGEAEGEGGGENGASTSKEEAAAAAEDGKDKKKKKKDKKEKVRRRFAIEGSELGPDNVCAGSVHTIHAN